MRTTILQQATVEDEMSLNECETVMQKKEIAVRPAKAMSVLKAMDKI